MHHNILYQIGISESTVRQKYTIPNFPKNIIKSYFSNIWTPMVLPYLKIFDKNF